MTQMKLATRNLLLLVLGVTLGISLTIGHSVLAQRESAPTTLPLNELRTFSEVFASIKSHYVEPVEDKVLLENAIRGMLSGLDPHSAYLDEKDYTDLKVGTSGEFGGLGIEVGMEDGFVKVIAPIDDTPAQRAGIQAGDLVIRLDETPVKGLTLKDAVDIMRGKPGTSILLTVIREGSSKPLKIEIIRDIIKVTSVKSRLINDHYAYVRITQFQTNTGENLEEAIKNLKQESKNSLRGLVLDLRNNPGGLLGASVSVSDAFLDKGRIVYTEGRAEDSEISFNATAGDIIDGLPIVVLINVGSASASEIVSGALQDHKRAIIMGTRSFGKGSVQSVMPLKDGNALKLTTARYYTPSGRSIQAAGIEPDILLENIHLAAVEEPEFKPLKEASLAGHLDNGDTPNPDSKEIEATEKQKHADLARDDFQLFEALNLLQGLHLLQK
jgi:carboxyl-terminal processing protease